MMKPIDVIGMGLSPDDLTAGHLQIIEAADILAGGRRHLSYFKNTGAVQYEIGADLKGLIQKFKRLQKTKSIVVLASGDPLYYGIGRRLVDDLGPERVVIHPNITTVAGAFARLKRSWAGVPVVSLHGRDNIAPLVDVLRQNECIAVFTDPERHPGWLAGQLLKAGLADYEMCVLEQLGMRGENVVWYALEAAVQKRFREPNLAVLQRRRIDAAEKRALSLGMPEGCFEHERGLITKAEVRAVTLAKLSLGNSNTLWDLGAGSGSVSIEAGLFIKQGRMVAVEQNASRIEHIRRNKKRFGLKNLDVVAAVLPDGLEGLPDPDRIFVGGGGHQLKHILQKAAGRLQPGGIIVVNTVLIDSLQTARQTLQKMKFTVDVVQVQIHRSRAMPVGDRLEAENPVWIIRGEKARDAVS